MDKSFAVVKFESLKEVQACTGFTVQGHPTTVSSDMDWKVFLGYPEFDRILLDI